MIGEFLWGFSKHHGADILYQLALTDTHEPHLYSGQLNDSS